MTKVDLFSDHSNNDYAKFFKAMLTCEDDVRRAGKSYLILEVLIQISLEKEIDVVLFDEFIVSKNVHGDDNYRTTRNTVRAIIENYAEKNVHINVEYNRRKETIKASFADARSKFLYETSGLFKINHSDIHFEGSFNKHGPNIKSEPVSNDDEILILR